MFVVALFAHSAKYVERKQITTNNYLDLIGLVFAIFGAKAQLRTNYLDLIGLVFAIFGAKAQVRTNYLDLVGLVFGIFGAMSEAFSKSKRNYVPIKNSLINITVE
ncbi:MAG: hypothetical protein AAF349_11785 [Cyanobacteria bacterium P01_A01_bin.68]